MTRFRITNHDGFEATIDADLSILTTELATEINTFWGGAEDRLRDQGGDVQKTVVRLFGARVLNEIAAEGGGDIDPHGSAIYTRQLLDEEGWPGSDWKGLLMVRAETPTVDYFDFTMTEAA